VKYRRLDDGLAMDRPLPECDRTFGSWSESTGLPDSIVLMALTFVESVCVLVGPRVSFCFWASSVSACRVYELYLEELRNSAELVYWTEIRGLRFKLQVDECDPKASARMRESTESTQHRLREV